MNVQQTNSALLVIDVQLGGFDRVLCEPMHEGQRLIKHVNMAIESARANQIPIIFIQHSNLPGTAFGPDTNGWQMHPDLDYKNTDRIVHKRASDGFENTDLDEVLNSMDVSTIVVCGLQSEFCITNTSTGALASGRKVTVIADAHGTQGIDAPNIIARQNTWLESQGAQLVELNALNHWFAHQAQT